MVLVPERVFDCPTSSAVILMTMIYLERLLLLLWHTQTVIQKNTPT